MLDTRELIPTPLYAGERVRVRGRWAKDVNRNSAPHPSPLPRVRGRESRRQSMARRMTVIVGLIFLCCVWLTSLAADREKPHPYRLSYIEIKSRVLWGSTCEAPDGTALSFGGEDQQSEDGQSHTRLRVNGEWIDLKGEIEKQNAYQSLHEEISVLRFYQKNELALLRHDYLEGLPPADLAKIAKQEGSLSEPQIQI